LFLSPRADLRAAGAMKQTCDSKGRKMLPEICRLLDRQLGVALDDYAIEIFFEQRLHPFGQIPNNLGLEPLDLVENGKRPVLEDRVCVQDEDSSFHNCQRGGQSRVGSLPGVCPSLVTPLSRASWPGVAAPQNARAQLRVLSENALWPPSEGPRAPSLPPNS